MVVEQSRLPMDRLSIEELGDFLGTAIGHNEEIPQKELGMALALAALQGSAQRIELLLAVGADPTLPLGWPGGAGATSLHLLASGAEGEDTPRAPRNANAIGKDEMRQMMLDLIMCSGGVALLEAHDRMHDATPLIWTGWYHQPVAASVLLELGADFDATDRYGQSFLDYASGSSPFNQGDATTHASFLEWKSDDSAEHARNSLASRYECALCEIRRRRGIAGPLERLARIEGARAALAVGQWWTQKISGGRTFPPAALSLVAHCLMKSTLYTSTNLRAAWTPTSRPRIPRACLERIAQPATSVERSFHRSSENQ